MTDPLVVIDNSDETPETPESKEFPWKKVFAALAVGATSVAVVTAIAKSRNSDDPEVDAASDEPVETDPES
jgi:hypothetical protein